MSARVPGEGLLHPVALASIAVLVLNDHVLKDAFPGFVTGKLSDIAGLVFFPLLLVSIAEHARLAPIGDRRVLAGAIVVTTAAFAWIELTALGDRAWEVGLGLCQWPFYALADLAAGRAIGGPVPIEAVADPTDVGCIPAALVALRIARGDR